jgi:tetratricopeptide (TPR) repeat protein
MRKFLIAVSFFTGAFFLTTAQSLDQAKKWYDEGLYLEAKPAFEKLVKQSPNNSSYSLWYGVCCYETDDLETAEKYLLLARSRKMTEACRYLATMYTSMYRYKEAAEMWEDYIDQLTKKKEHTETYKTLLERVEKLSRMKDRAEDVQVIDSMVVSKDRILYAYFLSEDCGVMQMDRDFLNSSDASMSTVYINPKGDRAFYARQGLDKKYALYSQTKLLDIWTDEKALFPSDTEDNNYPFVLGDGVTLYFASKGNGSIGGYDLFITRYNTNSNAYLAPEQLSMPFNSPANDYMMVIDEVKRLGGFVSDRFQPAGKVCI